MKFKKVSKSVITPKDEKILYFLRNFIIYNKKDNLISLSYNQIANHVTKHTDFSCTPKQAKRYMYIFSRLGLVVLIAKPRRNRTFKCMGRAKSIYVVSDTYVKDGIEKIKWNALENALKLEKFDILDKQFIGKLTIAEFLAYFEFNLNILKKFKKFLIEILNEVYKYYKNGAEYITYNYNKHRYSYIVYPSFFMQCYEDIFKSIKLPSSQEYLEVLNGS